MAKYTIEDTTLTGMANAIRTQWGYPNTKKLTPAQIISKIDKMKIRNGSACSISGTDTPWERPNGWPNLDSMTLPAAGQGDVMYLTYDLSKVEGICDPFISIFLRSSSKTTITITRGTITGNDFESAQSWTTELSASTAYYFFEELDVEDGTVQVWKITSTKPLNRFGFIPASSGTARYNMSQPCVERYGRLDGLLSLSGGESLSGSTNISWSTYWLEREKIVMAGSGVCTSTSGAYFKAYSLVSLDVSEWNTTNWAITSLQSMFASCWSLLSLDLSSWVTTNWAVTSLTYCFQDCFSLKYLNINWNTTNWAVTNLSNMFAQCNSLIEVNLNWNTTNWEVTTLAAMFTSCYSLQSLDLNSWDTSGWRVTKMNSMFSNCYALKELKVDEWDTSDWIVDTISYLFYSCQNLTTLNVSTWDVSNWRPTTLSYAFGLMLSLKKLDLTAWEVDDWNPTTIASCFYNLTALDELDIHTWNTSGWTSLSSLGSWFSPVRAKHVYLPDNLFKNSTYSTSSTFSFNVECLIDFNGYSYYKDNCNYGGNRLLTHDSLVAIFTRLPTVTSKTLTIGSFNQTKVTAAELAIATGKGWTVA